MRTKLLTLFGTLSVLLSFGAFAQQGKPATHPQAEKAMAKIVIKKDFGNKLKLHSREVVTMLQNDGVPGLMVCGQFYAASLSINTTAPDGTTTSTKPIS